MAYVDGTVLPPGEAAIVTSNDCTGLELLMPKLSDEDAVPRLALALTACFIRLQKESTFIDEQIDWMNAQRIPG